LLSEIGGLFDGIGRILSPLLVDIRVHLGEEAIWHGSTDAAAIEAREKPHAEEPTPAPSQAVKDAIPTCRANASVLGPAQATAREQLMHLQT